MINRKELYVLNYKKMKMNDFDVYKSLGYYDPDVFPSNKSNKVYNYNFYETMCTLLQNKLKILIKEPKYKRKLDSISFKCDPLHDKKCKKGIFIYSTETFQLKSDQFGFSAKYGDNYYIYPYRVFFENLSKNISQKELNKQIEKIFGDKGWINKTRMVGGSFFWPVDFDLDDKDKYGNNSYNPKYNGKRGGHCGSNKTFYLQDRVDLTLYEIKEVYKEIIAPRIDKYICGNKLSRCLYKNNNKTKTYKFLELFGDFETFIKVFGFDGNFVQSVGDEWKIVNVFETIKKDLNNPKKIKYIDDNYIEEARNGEHLLNTSISSEKFENMFDVICKLIEERRKNLGIAGIKE